MEGEIPLGRMNFGSVVVDDKILVIGGEDDQENSFVDEQFMFVCTLSCK